MRGWIGNGLLLLATTALLFGAGEVALRALVPEGEFGTDPILARDYRPHQNLRYVSSHGEFDVRSRYNSLGMRGAEHALEKRPGVSRVLILGDSFMEAKQIEDADLFARRLEESLGAFAPAEVINTGRSGFGAAEQYLVLRHFGISRSPDLVIQQFFVNDPFDDLEMVDRIEWDARGVPVRRLPDGVQSHVARYLVDVWRRVPFVQKRALITRDVTGDLRRDPFAVLRSFASDNDEHWERTLRALEASARLAEAHGARYLLMAVPLEVQVDGALADSLASAWSLSVEEVTRDPQDRLLRFGAARGIEVLDLVPAFEAHADERIYYPCDGHWTPRGHAIATRAVVDRLQRLAWWPPTPTVAARVSR